MDTLATSASITLRKSSRRQPWVGARRPARIARAVGTRSFVLQRGSSLVRKRRSASAPRAGAVGLGRSRSSCTSPSSQTPTRNLLARPARHSRRLSAACRSRAKAHAPHPVRLRALHGLPRPRLDEEIRHWGRLGYSQPSCSSLDEVRCMLDADAAERERAHRQPRLGGSRASVTGRWRAWRDDAARDAGRPMRLPSRSIGGSGNSL